MGYRSNGSRRRQESAGKSNHSHLINNPEVVAYLKRCQDTRQQAEDLLDQGLEHVYPMEEMPEHPIQAVIAVDGGFNTVEVNKNFPSSALAYFQFGALFFNLEDLQALDDKPYLAPEDMARFKELERITLVLPLSYISYGDRSLLDSIRATIFEFFRKDRSGDSYMETLRWFVYHEYDNPGEVYNLSSCSNPQCLATNIPLHRSELVEDQIPCPSCQKPIFLTDIFRLHEVIDEDLGAGGILGYLTNLLENLILVHFMRYILRTKPKSFEHLLFLKDGPLGFFGQTANLHRPMRRLCTFLQERYALFMVGLEKSGAFVDHAALLCVSTGGRPEPLLPANHYLLLSNRHIYRFILPGRLEEVPPYANTSYYGGKVIFHTGKGYVYVLTVPVGSEKVVLNPSPAKYPNLPVILRVLEDLRCDIYQNALVPVALVNQLVSIADRPSTVLLEKFSRGLVE